MLSFYLLGAKKLFSFLKKVLFIITVYFIIISLFFNLSNKNKKYENNQIKIVELQKKIDDSFIKDKEMNKSIQGKYSIEIYKTSNCFLFGDFCSSNKKNNINESLFGKINNLFIYLFSIRPASFTYWASNSMSKAGFIPNVLADDKTPLTGIGFQSIKMLYLLWENFRNLSFLIITLVLVTIGFMIMFRTKINPQTVISIENALPKIVIAMILITFSYPIVGLMIDLMYISLPIVAGLFKNILYMPIDEFSKGIYLDFLMPKLSPMNLTIGNILLKVINNVIKSLSSKINGNKSVLDLLFDQFINGSVFSIIFDWFNVNLYIKTLNDIVSGAFLTGNSIVAGIILKPLIKAVLSFLTLFLSAMLINPVGNFFSDKLGDIGGGQGISIVKIIFFGILSVVISNLLIVGIAILGLLFLAFRIFFFLLSCLFNLIVYTIIAPLYLLLEAVPGKSSFSSWIKNIIGNLIVFPAFLFIILLQRSLYIFMISNPNTQVMILPGLNFTPGISLGAVVSISVELGSNISLFFASILNIYILLMTPDLLKLVKATIIGKEGLSIPAGAGILFGGVGAAGGSIMGFANQFYYLKMGYDTFFGNAKAHGAEKGEIKREEEGNKFRSSFLTGIKNVFNKK